MRIPARIAYGAAPFVFVAIGCSGPANAQNATQAYVVANCGTPGITLTAGKNGPVFQNTSGSLCTSGGSAGGGGLAITDGTTFTAGTSLFTPIGGEYNSSPTSLTSGDQGTLALSSTRAALVDVATTTSTLYSVLTAPTPLLARSSEPVAATNASAVAAMGDLTGKIITSPYANRENMLRCAVTIATSIASTACVGMPAQNATTKIYITDLTCTRNDTGTTAVSVTLNDSATTIIDMPNNGGGGGFSHTYNVPLVIAANTTATITLGALINTTHCSATGFTGY
jgi:hypothetical protein